MGRRFQIISQYKYIWSSFCRDLESFICQTKMNSPQKLWFSEYEMENSFGSKGAAYSVVLAQACKLPSWFFLLSLVHVKHLRHFQEPSVSLVWLLMSNPSFLKAIIPSWLPISGMVIWILFILLWIYLHVLISYLAFCNLFHLSYF